MSFFKHEEWVALLSKRKIIYYPEFYYGLLNENYQKVFDNYFIENKVRMHLHRMKLLLLYFHYISVPFCNFYVNFNNNHTHLYNSIFKNNDFRELIANGLIIYELRSKYDSLSYFNRYESELKKYGSINTFPLNDDLNNIFHDLLVVERGEIYLNRSYGMQEAINNTISKSKFNNSDLDLIKRTIDKCSSGGNAFMHEIFVYELQYPKFYSLHNTLSNNYLEISETSNYNTLTYTPKDNRYLGSKLRKNITNNVYAFLYSPDFFEYFLSLFIDLRKDVNLHNLSLKNIINIRSHNFWDDFVKEYHEIITQVSNQLHYTTEDKIFKEAKKSITNKLDISLFQKTGFLLLKSILFGILTNTKLPFSPEVLNEAASLNKSLTLLQLNKKYKAIKSFFHLILSLV